MSGYFVHLGGYIMGEDIFDECRKCIYYDANGCNRKKGYTSGKRCFHYVDRYEAKNEKKELDKLIDSMIGK